MTNQDNLESRPCKAALYVMEPLESPETGSLGLSSPLGLHDMEIGGGNERPPDINDGRSMCDCSHFCALPRVENDAHL